MNLTAGLERLKIVWLIISILIGSALYFFVSQAYTGSQMPGHINYGIWMVVLSGWVPFIPMKLIPKTLLYVTLVLVGLSLAEKGWDSAGVMLVTMTTITVIFYVCKWIFEGFFKPN